MAHTAISFEIHPDGAEGILYYTVSPNPDAPEHSVDIGYVEIGRPEANYILTLPIDAVGDMATALKAVATHMDVDARKS